MSVNGVTSAQAAATYAGYAKTGAAKDTTAAENSAKKTTENSGVVYEPSKDKVTDSAKKTYKPNTALVNQLKADAEQRAASFRNMVEKMMSKQTNSYGQANDIWKFLAGGKYTVDAATKLKAQQDISEDGYWGVNQTSDRIVQFATALTGGDPDKIEEMRSAFLKGYKQAEKTWGGSLPDISRRTYDAVMEKFDKMKADANKAADPSQTE